MTDTTNIYILKLKNNKYYVGKSNDPQKRFKEHISGNGSAFTKKYKPISIEKIIPNATKYDEDKWVKIYMEKYGIENVRGGAYSCVDLDEDQICSLANEFVSANDLCKRCFRSGHFITSCYATTDINGDNIDTSSSDGSSSDSDEEPVKYKNKTVKKTPCYRCGRDGHFITSCYASTHIKGYVLK
jgi:hypothetical protein